MAADAACGEQVLGEGHLLALLWAGRLPRTATLFEAQILSQVQTQTLAQTLFQAQALCQAQTLAQSGRNCRKQTLLRRCALPVPLRLRLLPLRLRPRLLLRLCSLGTGWHPGSCFAVRPLRRCGRDRCTAALRARGGASAGLECVLHSAAGKGFGRDTSSSCQRDD